MNDWRAKERQEYALGAIAMGQWGLMEHMGTVGNGYLTPLDLQGETCSQTWPKLIYNPITAMGFWAMFTFQLDNTKRYTLLAP